MHGVRPRCRRQRSPLRSEARTAPACAGSARRTRRTRRTRAKFVRVNFTSLHFTSAATHERTGAALGQASARAAGARRPSDGRCADQRGQWAPATRERRVGSGRRARKDHQLHLHHFQRQTGINIPSFFGFSTMFSARYQKKCRSPGCLGQNASLGRGLRRAGRGQDSSRKPENAHFWMISRISAGLRREKCCMIERSEIDDTAGAFIQVVHISLCR